MKKTRLVVVGKLGASPATESTETAEVYRSASFTSIPEDVYREFCDVAKGRDMYPRDLFTDALNHLFSERARGHGFDYVASRKGGTRKTIWLSDKTCNEIDLVAQNDKVSKTVVLLTSMKLFSEKEGLNVKL